MKQILFGLAAALAWMSIHAQAEGPQRRHHKEINETITLLEQVMTARLTRELELDDEAMLRLVRRVSEHRERMRALSDERNGLMRSLRQTLQRNSGEDIAGKIDAILAIEEQLTAERLAFHKENSQELTPSQHAQLFLFLHDFDMEMRQLIDRAREHRGERGPGPGGPRMRRGPNGGPRGEPRENIELNPQAP